MRLRAASCAVPPAGHPGFLSLLAGVLLTACDGSSSAPVRVASVVVQPATATRNLGESVQFTALASDANGNPVSGRSVTWTSSSQAVATISSNGTATAVGLGRTTITARVDGVPGTATLDVVPPVASITLTPESDTLGVGKTLQLGVVLKDASGGTVTGRNPTWNVAPSGVATVTPTGLVTAAAQGNATITATIDGRTDVVTILVVDPCSTLLSTPLAVGQTLQGQLESNDCRLGDGSFLDGYRVTPAATTDVRIDLTSTAFDTYLILLVENNNALEEVDFNDDADGTTTNSRLDVTLEGGRVYHILANSFDPNQFGTYTVALTQAAIVGSLRAPSDDAPRATKSRVKRPFRELWPLR